MVEVCAVQPPAGSGAVQWHDGLKCFHRSAPFGLQSANDKVPVSGAVKVHNATSRALITLGPPGWSGPDSTPEPAPAQSRGSTADVSHRSLSC